MSHCVYPFRKIAVLPRNSQKFNLYHLRNISPGFKMAVLTPKLGIKEINRLRKEINRFCKGMSNIYLKVTVEKK